MLGYLHGKLISSTKIITRFSSDLIISTKETLALIYTSAMQPEYTPFKEIAKGKPFSARHYCFTLNNYSDAEVKALATPMKDVRYIVFGYETAPTTGTPHLQGYVEFGRPMRRKAISSLTGFERMSLFERRGTRDQARDYCLKTGKYAEYGNWESGGRGARTDINDLLDAINAGAGWETCINEFTQVTARCMRFVDKAMQLAAAKRAQKKRDVITYVHYGTSGCGKTSSILELYPNAFTVNCSDSFPFDGYNNEDVIILDDFYGNLPYHQLLNILEGYSLRVNVKGGHAYAAWTKVYITSNAPPYEWYKTVAFGDALIRRIDSVIKFEPFEIEAPEETVRYSVDVIDEIIRAEMCDSASSVAIDIVTSCECNDVPGVILDPGVTSELPSLNRAERAIGMTRWVVTLNEKRGNFSCKVMDINELNAFRGDIYTELRYKLSESWSTNSKPTEF